MVGHTAVFDFLKSVLTVSTSAVKLYVCTLFNAAGEPSASYHYIPYLLKSQGFTLIYFTIKGRLLSTSFATEKLISELQG